MQRRDCYREYWAVLFDTPLQFESDTGLPRWMSADEAMMATGIPKLFVEAAMRWAGEKNTARRVNGIALRATLIDFCGHMRSMDRDDEIKRLWEARQMVVERSGRGKWVYVK